MSDAPAISFVLPAHNAASALGAALASLRVQSRPDWEAVVVDDGSDDETAAIAACWAQADPRIRLIRQPRAGVAAARNAGLATARGRWLCFLDADDWVAPGFVEIMLAAADADPDTDLVHCAVERIDPHGVTIGEDFEAEFESRGFEMAARFCPVCIHTVVARTALVVGAGGFDPAYRTCEDWDLWQRLTRAGLNIVGVPLPLAKYRHTPKSLSRAHAQLLRDALRVVRQGHGEDARVRAPHPDHVAGLDPAGLAQQESCVALWIAASEVAIGGDGVALLRAIGHPLDCGDQDDAVLAEQIMRAFCIGACIPPAQSLERARRVNLELQRLLHEIAAGSRMSQGFLALAHALERRMLDALPRGAGGAFLFSAKLPIEIGAGRFPDAAPAAEELQLEWMSGGRRLGELRLAAPDRLGASELVDLALETFGIESYARLSGVLQAGAFRWTLARLLLQGAWRRLCGLILDPERPRLDLVTALLCVRLDAIRVAAHAVAQARRARSDLQLLPLFDEPGRGVQPNPGAGFAVVSPSI